MSKRKLCNDDSRMQKKRAPNFKSDEIMFLLNKIRNSKGTLFGSLSPKLTFKMKTEAWYKITDDLQAAGYPKRAKEQIKKKWEDLSTSTKAKYSKKKKTGGGPVDWNDMDDLISEIIGKENPSLTSIVGGIDSGESSKQTFDIGDSSEIDEEVTDVGEEETGTNFSKKRQDEIQQQHQTSEKKLAEPKDTVADEKTKFSYGQQAKDAKKEKITQVTNLYEQQMTEEHVIKMRILAKKEHLLDLQIAIAKEEISQMNQ